MKLSKEAQEHLDGLLLSLSRASTEDDVKSHDLEVRLKYHIAHNLVSTMLRGVWRCFFFLFVNLSLQRLFFNRFNFSPNIFFYHFSPIFRNTGKKCIP